MSEDSEKNEIVEKAINYIKNSDLTDYKIAVGTGLSRMVIGNYRKDKSKPSKASAATIVSFFENHPVSNDKDNFQKSVPYEFVQSIVEERKRHDEATSELIRQNGILVDILKNDIDEIKKGHVHQARAALGADASGSAV